jgi:hypothetical protein
MIIKDFTSMKGNQHCELATPKVKYNRLQIKSHEHSYMNILEEFKYQFTSPQV